MTSAVEISPLMYRTMSTSCWAAMSVVPVQMLIELATFSPVSGSSPSTMIPQ